MQTLPRYVLVEVIKVFALSVSALTLMVVLGFVGREATAQGLPLLPTLRLIPYFLPETLRVTVPMTLLLSCTTVFSRISGANEIVAVKAMGISPMTLLWPVFIFSFIVSLVTVWLNDVADSWGHANVQRVIVEGAEEIIYSMLQSQRRYSSSAFSINVKEVDGRKLSHITLIINDHADSSKMTITAEEAELRSGVDDHGERVLKIFLRKGRIDVADRVSFDFPDVLEREIPLTDASRARNGGPQAALTLSKLPDAITAAKVQVEQQEQMMAALAAYEMTCGDLDDLTGDVWHMHENILADLRSRYLPPAVGAAAPLGGRFRLPLLRAGRRANGYHAAKPRLPHQLLPLLPADPARLLSADDHRRRPGEKRQAAHVLRLGGQRHVGPLGPGNAAASDKVLSSR